MGVGVSSLFHTRDVRDQLFLVPVPVLFFGPGSVPAKIFLLVPVLVSVKLNFLVPVPVPVLVAGTGTESGPPLL